MIGKPITWCEKEISCRCGDLSLPPLLLLLHQLLLLSLTGIL